MESRFTIAGHPAHPLMVTLPLGLLSTAVGFDLLGRIQGDDGWSQAADRMIVAGVVSGMVAAVPGAVDWMALPRRTRAKQVATLHGVGNAGVLSLFAIAWSRRRSRPEAPTTGVLAVQIVGLALAIGTGWLGGELVNRHAVGVHRGANLDAPSTLSGRPALTAVADPTKERPGA